MNKQNDLIAQRKSDHIALCLTDKVSFKEKHNGFDFYDFKHYAITEVELDKINFKQNFLGRTINYPFIISCMTGGTAEAENINEQLAEAARELQIPIGVGSQRQALENKDYISSYKVIRRTASDVPLFGNIGASQIVEFKSLKKVQSLVEMVRADALFIHLNPLQELLQKEGEPNYKGFLKALEKVVRNLHVPVFIKEVGAGISSSAAKKLLDAGVKGIDVAGAGGTSWAGVEILRSNQNEQNYLWDWGLPTSYCIREVYKLKKKYKFVLVGSGGINSGLEMTKAFALGADFAASARIMLKVLNRSGVDGVIKIINSWFDELRRIMYLTGSHNLKSLRNRKIILKKDLY